MGSDPEWLEPMARFVQDRLHLPLTLASVAARFEMSRFHLAHRFKRVTGLSFHQYVLRQRIERAKHLLAVGVTPLAVVARRCGFSDHSHLTRHFKRQTGHTPSEYQRRQRDNRKIVPGFRKILQDNGGPVR